MRRTLLLVTALLAGLTLPASAPAQTDTRWVVDGAGFGHGIGMSQYGAYGMAQHGFDYRQILSHYYTDTDIGSARGQTIRVLLGDARAKVRFDGATRAGTKALDPTKAYTASYRKGKVRISGVGSFSGTLRVRGSAVRWLGTTMNGVTNGRFRSYLELRHSASGGLRVVNALGIDNYVRGVVANEMPSSWAPEALKAQALAARTYALTTNTGGIGFDQYPDERSQVYRGMASEAVASNSAVSSTAGQIVTYQGEAAVTYFFSTSGGQTENIENSFLGAEAQPWLKGVDDPYDDISPRHSWRLVYTPAQVKARLSGLVKGTFRGIEIVDTGVSPRVVHADIIGSSGRTRVTGPTLRARLGLYDTWFSVKKVLGTEAKRYRATGTPRRSKRSASGSSLQSSGWVQSSPAASPESSPAASWPLLGSTSK
jgi:stage II sporulation protein D